MLDDALQQQQHAVQSRHLGVPLRLDLVQALDDRALGRLESLQGAADLLGRSHIVPLVFGCGRTADGALDLLPLDCGRIGLLLALCGFDRLLTACCGIDLWLVAQRGWRVLRIDDAGQSALRLENVSMESFSDRHVSEWLQVVVLDRVRRGWSVITSAVACGALVSAGLGDLMLIGRFR